MKKLVVIISCLMLAVFSASAQPRLGIMGGFTNSQMQLKNIDMKSASAFHAGLTYHIPLALGFAVQPGVLYNVKGTNWEELYSQAKFGYIEVPVQIQYGLDLILARPYVFAEPFVGYAVNGSVKTDVLGTESKTKLDLSDMEGRLSYGFGIGAGLELLSKVQVAFKYYWNMEASSINEYVGSVASQIKERNSFDGMLISAVLFF